MRFGLRWKILLLTILTPLSLAAATLLVVHRDVAEHADASSLHENLTQSVAVFEALLATRLRALEGSAMVVARDPGLLSLLMLGLPQRDALFAATVSGTARDFNHITRADLFEVFDRRGRLLARAGQAQSSPDARAAMVRRALGGSLATGVIAEGRTFYQAVAVPFRADGRLVGALLLGSEFGPRLALELRPQTLCEVTFVAGRNVTGTTLADSTDRRALLDALDLGGAGPEAAAARAGAMHTRGSRSYLTIARRVPGSSADAAQYYVLQRTSESEEHFQRTIRGDLIALAALSLILAVVASFLFSEQILRPLQKLVRGAEEMESGNYDHPIEVHRRDELGYLAEQFQHMRARERAYVNSLEQATRLKSQFISIASHELRTPISVLSGYRDLLAEGSLGDLTDRQTKVIESMGEYLARLGRVAEDAAMVAEMRDERRSLDRRPVPLGSVVRLAVESARNAAGSRAVTVETLLESPDDLVAVDHQAFAQALTHLVANGIRFTPDGGRVDVSASVHGGVLTVVVSDTGVGMSESDVESLCSHGAKERDPAHHRSTVGLEFGSGGLGLGFTLARGIVAAHGGRIEIASREGEGSTFRVVVPAGDVMEEERPAA